MHFIDSVLTWLFSYPFLPLQIGLFLLLAWGRLGYGVGVDDLFWSQRIREQIFNGLACGCLFGEILLVRYLLESDHSWTAFVPVSLFPVGDAALYELGRFLALFWTAGLVALWGFKLFSRDVWRGEVRVWPLLVGLVLSVIAVTAGVYVGAEISAFEGWKLSSLHILAALTAVAFGLALAILYVCHFAGVALGRIGPVAQSAIPYLVKKLADGDWDVRQAAEEALGRIGPAARKSIPALYRAMDDLDSIMIMAAADALQKIQGHSLPDGWTPGEGEGPS